MSSSPHRTHLNHLESQGESEQHEDDVRSVEKIISLFSANKINKLNVWNCELIDKLDTLVKHHNAYIRNFRNIGMSLDATMKVYEIRVDSVCNDVRRLGFGIAQNTSQDKQTLNRSKRKSCEAMDELEISMKKQLRKRRRYIANISHDSHQLNGPLKLISLPDDLTSKLNLINDDTAASNRLFTTVVTTKDSALRLNCNERFIERYAHEFVRFREDFDYENDSRDFFTLPFNLHFAECLPIRQNGSGLSGYRIQDTPIDYEDYEEDSMMLDDQAIAPEFIFDIETDSSFWPNRPTESSLISEDNNNDLPASNNELDMNNNDGIFLDGTTQENENLNKVNNILKGEYSYHAFRMSIRNYWAGPSYWKISKNRPKSQGENVAIEAKTRGRRVKKKQNKPTFNAHDEDDQSSENECFIKTSSRAAKKIRHCNYNRWAPEKLKLPKQNDIPKDFFHSYTFGPSFDLFHRESVDTSESNVENSMEDDFPQMDLENVDFQSAELPGDDDVLKTSCESETMNNISQHFEDLPPMVEKIPINFEKRAKVVNMTRLNSLTVMSIKRQLEKTAHSEPVSLINEFEPGKALFSNVFKDLQANKCQYMDKKSELTTGMALFSVLSAVNRQRLCISKIIVSKNDFEIAQLKKVA